MSLRHDPTDPAIMTPEDRLAEVAAILAEGVLRLRRRSGISPTSTPPEISGNPHESGQIGLELSAKSRLHGQHG